MAKPSVKKAMPASPLRISTMTLTCSVGGPVSLQEFGRCLDKAADGRSGATDAPLVCVRPGGFRNSLTADVHLPEKTINVKLFQNGVFQITGARSRQQSQRAVEALLASANWKGQPAFDYQTHLINADYKIGRELVLSKVHAFVRQHREWMATYDPSVYNGVKLLFFLRESGCQDGADGVCRCAEHCFTKRAKHRRCRMVMTSIFRTGSVIITGSVNMVQVQWCYERAVQLIEEGGDELSAPTAEQLARKLAEWKLAQ